MPGYVVNRRTHNMSVKAINTTTTGVLIPMSQVIPGFQETRSFRSGVQGPSDEETLQQDAQIYELSSRYNSPFDTGHEFYSVDSHYLDTTVPNWHVRYPDYPRAHWQGAIVPTLGTGTNYENNLCPVVLPMSSSRLATQGTRAISATIPTKPEAGLAQFIGELKRDGIPSLIGATLLKRGDSLPKKLGGEFLNLEFGVKPFVSDITKLMKAVKNSSRLVRQFERDSGRIVRRRFSFPESRDVVKNTYRNTTGGSQMFANIPRSMLAWDSSTVQEIEDVSRERVWFSGSYTYYCDMGSTLMARFVRYEQLANKLLGSRLTPAVIWDLAPWSWLLDWFADVGVVLDNASAFQSDGLVIRHGYLMRETHVMRSVSTSFIMSSSSLMEPTPVTARFLTVRKERFKATPFGFGLLEESFDLRQWAILGALGMTRAPSKLM